MQTFILRNGNNQDVQLLLDISKKLGLSVIRPTNRYFFTQTRKTHNFSEQDIVDECRKVRAELQK